MKLADLEKQLNDFEYFQKTIIIPHPTVKQWIGMGVLIIGIVVCQILFKYAFGLGMNSWIDTYFSAPEDNVKIGLAIVLPFILLVILMISIIDHLINYKRRIKKAYQLFLKNGSVAALYKTDIKVYSGNRYGRGDSPVCLVARDDKAAETLKLRTTINEMYQAMTKKEQKSLKNRLVDAELTVRPNTINKYIGITEHPVVALAANLPDGATIIVANVDRYTGKVFDLNININDESRIGGKYEQRTMQE